MFLTNYRLPQLSFKSSHLLGLGCKADQRQSEQLGVRMEKRLVKVLKAMAEYHDMTLGGLDKAVEKLGANNIPLPRGIEGHGESRWVMFHDPAGNLIELAQDH